MTTLIQTPRSLKKPLPEEISWMQDEVLAQIKPAGFLRRCKNEDVLAAPGSTRAWGAPDIPLDAPWAPASHRAHLLRQWAESPYDGESFYMQLDLASIPSEVRSGMTAPIPTTGVVWVFIDLSKEHWTGTARFDPRARQDIPWTLPQTDWAPSAQWQVTDTLPFASDKTFPQIAWAYSDLADAYDDWLQDTYMAPTDFQIGGWGRTYYNDQENTQDTFVLSLVRQSFGDNGAVFLHYSQERGFHVSVETC